MIVIVIAAFMTALVTILLLQPLAQGATPQRRLVRMIAVIVPLTALLLYLWVGAPDMPSVTSR